MSIETIINEPPLAQGYPLLGNALDMQQDLMRFLVKQYRLLGPIFRIRALNQQFIVLAGPEANTFVTQQGGDKFRSDEYWRGFCQEFNVPNNIPSLDGDPHIQMRKLFKPALSVSNFLSDIPLLVDTITSILDDSQTGQPMSARYLFRRIITEQLGRALASWELEDDLQPLIILLKFAFGVHVAKQMPTFMLRSPSYQRAKRRILNMGHEILATHRTKTDGKEDFIDAILDASKKPEFQETLGSEQQLALTAIAPFIVGLDTVANECTFLLYELLNHPDLLTECVAEADQFFANGLPTEEQIRDPHSTLRYAMLETLRLHAVGPVTIRTAAKDFVFAGHQVREGQTVMFGMAMSHFLSELFPSPYLFDIGRYSEERREHKQLGAYVPFGIGTHMCLGAGTAEAQIVLVIATLLHLVHMERLHPQTKLRAKFETTLTLGDALRIAIHKREKGALR